MTFQQCLLYLFFCGLILGAPLPILAQETTPSTTPKTTETPVKKVGAKIYFSLNTSKKTDSLATGLSKTKEFTLGNPLPAFTFFSFNGNFQELVFEELILNRKNRNQYVFTGVNLDSLDFTNGQIQTLFLLSFDYHYAFRLFKKNPDAKFKTYLGFALCPYMANNKFKPKDLTTSAYPVRQFNLGTTVDIVPRFNVQLSKHWFLDFHIPINLGSATWIYTKNEDPNIPTYQHVKQDVLFDRVKFKNQRTFYLGIGLKM